MVVETLLRLLVKLGGGTRVLGMCSVEELLLGSLLIPFKSERREGMGMCSSRMSFWND